MNFTAQQRQAILFIVAIFLMALTYRLIGSFLYAPEPVDFSVFEARFTERYQEMITSAEADSTTVQQSALAKAAISPLPLTPTPKKRISKPKPAASPSIININTATIDELTTLPRIGPKIAARIIAFRSENGPFATKRDLTKVKGIGKKTYEKLKKLIVVE